MDHQPPSTSPQSMNHLHQVDIAKAIRSHHSNGSSLTIEDIILASIHQNKLVRLSINKGLGVKLSVPGRIIDYAPATQLIYVYHVDEKQVYTFKLNEIDDFLIS